jgi:membrane-associated phospholipid phosphatase
MFLRGTPIHTLLLAAPEWLIRADRKLFALINQQLSHPFLDAIFPWWRESITWTPLYLFLLLFVIANGKKSSLPWIIMAVITILLSDQISSSIIKPLFARLRPCNEPELAGSVRLLLDGCGAGYSFTSSHATNHFAIAVFLMITLQKWLKGYGWILLLWAGSVAYGQVYVGVHYPLDIVGGALLGSGIGFCTARLYLQRLGELPFLNSNPND